MSGNQRNLRIGVFGRHTSPHDGGANTLLAAVARSLAGAGAAARCELVEIPWSEWSHRRRPLRYLWSRLVRWAGSEVPLVDLRPVCRRHQLEAAYFAAPAFARIDVPFVFTVWDLGHRTIPEFPEMRSGRDPWSHREAMYRTMVGQASYVVVGNESGREEVGRAYGKDPARIRVLPFPNPEFPAAGAGVPAWLPNGNYFLYPAQFWPHKNHETLLQALAELARGGGPAVDLVFVGADKGSAGYLRQRATELGVAERVIFPGFVSRAELATLYRRATGLVFPSLLGPNNLPPQEAAVLECPMILSDLPGHREQLGAGALLVPGLDPVAWAAAMRRLRDEPETRRTLVQRARDAVAPCTPERYAAGLGSVLAELAQQRRRWSGSSR